MKHDCPWCGISLKWRYVPSKPLQDQREILPLLATPVCPSCGGRLTPNKPEEKTPNWQKWGSCLLFVTWCIFIWTRVEILAYASAGLLIVLVVAMFITSMTRKKEDGVMQKYCKYYDSHAGI